MGQLRERGPKTVFRTGMSLEAAGKVSEAVERPSKAAEMASETAGAFEPANRPSVPIGRAPGG